MNLLITSLFCLLILWSTQVCGAWVIPLVKLPIPTLDCHSLNGMIGIVSKKFFPNFSIGSPTALPSELDLIAAKTIVHKSPIAKKLTISQENRSSVHHRSKSWNSISEIPATLNVWLPLLFCIGSIWRFWAISGAIFWFSHPLNPLISAVIKIRERLNAATVTTGAKMMPMTLLMLI